MAPARAWQTGSPDPMSDSLMKSMGKAVRQARESLGLTQVEVAEHLGITVMR